MLVVGDFVMPTRVVEPQRLHHQIRTISRYAHRSRSGLSSKSKADTPVRETESRNDDVMIFIHLLMASQLQ